METMEQTKTQEQMFKEALKLVRRLGVRARYNVSGCCRSCITYELDDTQDQIWHYGGQGNRIMWDSGTAYSAASWERYGNVAYGTVFLNHHFVTDGIGEQVVEVLRSAGLTVEWDGSSSQCIMVVFDGGQA